MKRFLFVKYKESVLNKTDIIEWVVLWCEGHTSLSHRQSYLLSYRLTWLVEWNGLICLFSANDMWSSGCQSLVYTTSSKFTVSRTELMAGMTPSPSWPAGQLRRARLPSRKSFCTSTTIKAELGCKIWKIQKIIFHLLNFNGYIIVMSKWHWYWQNLQLWLAPVKRMTINSQIWLTCFSQ